MSNLSVRTLLLALTLSNLTTTVGHAQSSTPPAPVAPPDSVIGGDPVPTRPADIVSQTWIFWILL